MKQFNAIAFCLDIMALLMLRRFFFSKRRLGALFVLLSGLLAGASPAAADSDNPLEPIDTSSPRGTLQGFIEFVDKGYEARQGLLRSYLNSSRLYLSADEIAVIRRAQRRLEAAERALDLSALPPAMAQESSRRLALQLKEVLDRIDIPPFESIPDVQAMDGAEFKRWTLPNSEIRIARVRQGPRAGEYLFTPDTVQRLPEFYLKIKGFPYKSGATEGLYAFSAYQPAGVALALRRVIPPRWLLNPPYWAQITFLDQPLWRWAGIVAVFGAGLAAVMSCFRISRCYAGREAAVRRWTHLLRPLSIVAVTPVLVVILAEVLRISGTVYEAVTRSLWTVFYLALTWAVWAAGGAVAESVIVRERLLAGSIDSQLIRLAIRLLTTIAAIAILVVGADRIGLPAYSVLAGLGVGGLAMALAAQQTLANLLGSLIIMFEKPFVIGHWVKVNDIEGTVENVGFRSTSIRTFYNSLVTIPSSQVVNSTVDNMGRRAYRRVKTVLNLTYDTPAGKIEAFAEGIREIIRQHPHTHKGNIQVVFHDFGPHSLDILVYFFLQVPDWSAELLERQRILLDILRLAETDGVQFAFPTETVHIESWPGDQRSGESARAVFKEGFIHSKLTVNGDAYQGHGDNKSVF
ncbi:MAG: mechanosensitive ion channel family protein [Gammaproteobacteria bacterium]